MLRSSRKTVQMGIKPGAEVPDKRSATGSEAETVIRPLDKSVDILGNHGIGLAEDIQSSPAEMIRQSL
jgi:hypothetical protein